MAGAVLRPRVDRLAQNKLKSELEEKKPPDLGRLDYNNKTEVKKFKKGQQEGLRLHKEGQQDQERCLHEESLQEERLRLHEEGQQQKKKTPDKTVIVIKEKADMTELQEQEQHNAKKFLMVGNLEGKIGKKLSHETRTSSAPTERRRTRQRSLSRSRS